MYNTRIIALFSTLSDEEKRRFRKWMKSDFVNKNEDITTFFEYIDSRANLSPRTITKQKAYDYIYPGTPYRDLRIRHLMWMATEIIEDFVVYNKSMHDDIYKQHVLAQHYAAHEFYKYSELVFEDILLKRQKAENIDIETHLQKYQSHLLYFRLKSRDNRSSTFNLQQVIDHFTLFVIIETLKNACVQKSIQKISTLTVTDYLQDSVMELLKNPVFAEDTFVRIYHNLYKILTNEDEDAFNIFVVNLNENNHLFEKQDLKELYLLAINFCVKKSNQNIRHYTQMAFELYIHAINKGYLIEHKELSRFSLTNIVTLGIKLNELSKTEKFVQQYAKNIAIEYRKYTVDFNMAKILYAKGQLSKALKLLLTNEFKDILWSLNAKFLTLKILFETKNMKVFAVHLRAFKSFVNRKANIGYHQAYFINATNALTQLSEIYYHPDRFKEFQFAPDTSDVEWFTKLLMRITTEKPAEKPASKIKNKAKPKKN